MWTPYAAAIADNYAVRVPMFLTVPTTLTGVALQRKTVITAPFEHDCLIMGATLQPDNAVTADFGQNLFLNLFNNNDNIDWVTPNIVGGAPLTAFGGRGDQLTSVQRLPEACFIPAGATIQHEFTQPTGAANTGGSITWVGVQMMHPRGGATPKMVAMPDGSVIRVGSRMPWFSAWGFGLRFFAAGAINFAPSIGGDAVYYTPPVDCPLEIHDLHSTTFSIAAGNANPDAQFVKVAIAGRRDIWSADLTPFTGVWGDRNQIYQSLPLVKPLKLRPYERLMFRILNNDSSGNLGSPIVAVRGVRLCEF